jgi:hypothetical protein
VNTLAIRLSDATMMLTAATAVTMPGLALWTGIGYPPTPRTAYGGGPGGIPCHCGGGYAGGYGGGYCPGQFGGGLGGGGYCDIGVGGF